jgi:hypothetical protein
MAQVFELGPVVARLAELVQGEKVEVLEYSLGSLYVGTSQGRILQYGLAEWRDSEGSRQFSCSLAATVELAPGRRVSQLHAAPAIDRLLAFCDSTLSILRLADLALLPTAGSTKLKGLSAVCVNSEPGEGGPYSLELCVAKRKQGQLALLSLSEEKLAVVRTRECAAPVLAMALAGPHLCCAHPATYTVYNLATGASLPLFPTDCSETAPPPPILATGPEEFLLLGPGNLGVFVQVRQWSCEKSDLS